MLFKHYACLSHHTHWDSLVSSPDHTLYASSERGPDVIHQSSWAYRATPPMWKHMINIHRWLKPSTVLCTINCKLRKTWVDSTEDDLIKMREREWDCKATSLNHQVSKQRRLCLNKVVDCFFVAISLLKIAKPRKCLFHCLPSYWLKETHLILGLSIWHS